jgi:hypothetical protein
MLDKDGINNVDPCLTHLLLDLFHAVVRDKKGAVQEEIRFVICPELIAARLFTQTLQENEALLMKGAERYSNYNGYAGTFTWHSNHVDNTPR